MDFPGKKLTFLVSEIQGGSGINEGSIPFARSNFAIANRFESLAIFQFPRKLK
jgi:hypothetical protein